jgi:CO/xanthine dehydrogenase Mo-binding subunit
VLGGGVLVCLAQSRSWVQESGRSFGGHELPKDISAWLHIDADGHVKVFTGKVEVGQNIRTSLAQAVAEELRVPFDSITMVMGDTDLVPWDMGTFGSRTTPTMAPQLRNMAVAGRELLLQMAAQRWNTDAAKLIAAAGKVTTADGS